MQHSDVFDDIIMKDCIALSTYRGRFMFSVGFFKQKIQSRRVTWYLLDTFDRQQRTRTNSQAMISTPTQLGDTTLFGLSNLSFDLISIDRLFL